MSLDRVAAGDTNAQADSRADHGDAPRFAVPRTSHTPSRREFLALAGTSLLAASAARAWPPAAQPEFDVCIVGTGFAGTYLALRLVEQGWRVLLLEAGATLRRDESEEDRSGLLPSTGGERLGFRLADTRTIAVGGTSHRWSGVASRPSKGDLMSTSVGDTAKLWPISYSVLDPYLCEAESLLSVNGGTYRNGAEPDRFCPFPHSRTLDPALDRWATAFGLDFVPIPFSTRDGRPTALRLTESELPRLRAAPGVRLLDRQLVANLLVDENGVVTAAVALRPDGTFGNYRARTFVLANGPGEIPRVLLDSRSERHPSGIGNDRGLVGRYFTAHFCQRLRFPARPVFRGLRGASRTYGFADLFREHGCGAIHVDLRFKPDHVVLESMVEIESRFENRISTTGSEASPGRGTQLRFSLSERDRRTIVASNFVLRFLARQIGGPEASHRPVEKRWFHPSGTCRMSNRSDSGVVDGDCRVHGTKNLFVAGSALFPTAGSWNPTLTLIALALRLGDHLAARFNSL